MNNFVALATRRRKVPFGIYRVWFCRDYDEDYTNIYDACDHFSGSGGDLREEETHGI